MVTLTIFLLQSGLISCTTGLEEIKPVEDRKHIELEQQLIEDVRDRYEARILAINGVVFVSNGMSDNGKPCLTIGISVPVEDVRLSMPNELFIVEVKFDYVGEIRP